MGLATPVHLRAASLPPMVSEARGLRTVNGSDPSKVAVRIAGGGVYKELRTVPEGQEALSESERLRPFFREVAED